MTASEADEPLSRRARWSRRRYVRAAVAVGTAIVALAAVAIAAFGFGGDAEQRPASNTLPPATATVTRMTLTQTERVAGTLGYGPGGVVVARASTPPPPAVPTDPTAPVPPPSVQPATTNTITWLPAPGAIVKPGEPVYKVDNRPVVLIAGGTPLYHVLSDGVRGPDVLVLETNLRDFGYTGFTVDDTFTSATAFAVKQWQRALGWPQSGTVDVNQVAMAAGPIRVMEQKAALGADAIGEVLAYTATTRVVTVPLEVSRQHLISIGLTATVNLPGGGTVTGTVASIGTVASQPSDGGSGGSATVDVVVTIADQTALGALDSAPVDLVLVVAERENVLTVPIGALLALAEGGYGVQLLEGSTTRYVAVTTGMFGGGRVEVSGPEIAEGVMVGVPA